MASRVFLISGIFPVRIVRYWNAHPKKLGLIYSIQLVVSGEQFNMWNCREYPLITFQIRLALAQSSFDKFVFAVQILKRSYYLSELISCLGYKTTCRRFRAWS
jgi:hypothetical protein